MSTDVEDATFAPTGVGVASILLGKVCLITVERPTSAEAEALERDYGLTREDLDLALARATPAELVRRDRYVLIRAPVPVIAPRSEMLIASPVSLIVGNDFLLAVHAGEVRPLLRFLRQLETDEALRAVTATGGIDVLLGLCFERLLDAASAAQARLDRQTAAAEDALARGEARTGQEFSGLVRRREEIRLINRLIAALATVTREAAGLGLPSAEWERTIARAGRLAEAAADNRVTQDGLLMAYAAEANLRAARQIRGVLVVAALTLPVVAVGLLVDLVYAIPLTPVAVDSAIPLAVVGLTFIGSLYLLRRRRLL